MSFIIKKRIQKNYVQVTCRIEEELLDEIDKIVLEYNLKSRNSFINDAIKYAISNMRID